jgi:CheY-like chemotaxis protein/HPt (histidine-containing phosphotransfer) domain-containing protein
MADRDIEIAAPQADRPPIVVLLIDDQPFVGTALARLIAGEHDLQLHCCTDGTRALAHATSIRPDVILQDLVMADTDGLALTRMFRANPATADIPVIVLSGHDSSDTRTQAAEAGANDYLVKLPEKDVLIACIRRHARACPINGPGAVASVSDRADSTRHEHADETLDRNALAAFDDLGSGAFEFKRNLIEEFIDEAVSRVNTLMRAAQDRDAAALKATAHALKGTSLVVGANRLAALCAQLEHHLGRGSSRVVIASLAEAFGPELERVREALASYVRSTHESSIGTL